MPCGQWSVSCVDGDGIESFADESHARRKVLGGILMIKINDGVLHHLLHVRSSAFFPP